MPLTEEAKIFIRRRGEELFPDGQVSGSVLVSNISFGAAALGSGHVELVSSNEWWFVASEFDWLNPRPPHFKTVDELFSKIVPFPELGPNSVRPEIYAAAYTNRAYVDRNGEFHPILGDEIPKPLPHIDVVPPWCNYVLGLELEKS